MDAQLSAYYSLARLDGDRLLRLLDLSAERHQTAPRFWTWLRQTVESEIARRNTYALDATVEPREANVLDLSPLVLWEPADVADALKVTHSHNEGTDDIELSLFWSKLATSVVGLVYHRLKTMEARDDERYSADPFAWSDC
jgi:hypothetical protein